jgi:hypothetical protein
VESERSDGAPARHSYQMVGWLFVFVSLLLAFVSLLFAFVFVALLPIGTQPDQNNLCRVYNDEEPTNIKQ